MNPWQDVLSACDQVEATLAHAGPGNDPARLRPLMALCGQMKASSDPYISRTASQLESCAKLFFGPRRDKTATDEGAKEVLREMRYSLLRALREQANLKLRASK